MPSLSLNIGLNGGRKLPFGGGAPSGIPVASTASIVISGNVLLNGTHTRVGQGTEIMYVEGGDPDTFVLNGGTYLYRRPNSSFSVTEYSNSVLFPPNSAIKKGGGSGNAVAGTPFSTWTIGNLSWDSDAGEWLLFQIFLQQTHLQTQQ